MDRVLHKKIQLECARAMLAPLQFNSSPSSRRRPDLWQPGRSFPIRSGHPYDKRKPPRAAFGKAWRGFPSGEGFGHPSQPASISRTGPSSEDDRFLIKTNAVELNGNANVRLSTKVTPPFGFSWGGCRPDRHRLRPDCTGGLW